MSFGKRQMKILERARQAGSARIGDLAVELGVSLETIRRDITRLAAENRLRTLWLRQAGRSEGLQVYFLRHHHLPCL